MARHKKDYGTGMPEHEVEALAYCFLPDIQAFYETEQGQLAFKEWQTKQECAMKANRNKENNGNFF